MTDFQYWIFFLSSAIALNIAPGPDLIYILSKTLSAGKRAGLVSVLGLSCGAFIHFLLAATGVSLILKSSLLVFTLVKLMGAGYLLFLAYQNLHADNTNLGLSSSTIKQDNHLSTRTTESLLDIFKQAALVDLFNPKVALFFIAYLPAFVRENSTSISFQLLYLGGLVILIAIIIESIYVVVGAKLASSIKANNHFQYYINRTVSLILTLLAIKLILSSNS
ncbi:MAG: LysE family translocator [Enterobacterales bacterium]|nr:LysE family translocator [Enterobacterales bacterium]